MQVMRIWYTTYIGQLTVQDKWLSWNQLSQTTIMSVERTSQMYPSMTSHVWIIGELLRGHPQRMQYLEERYPNMCKWAKDCWQTDTNPILQSFHEIKTTKMKGTTPMLPLAWIMVLLHLQVGPTLCNPETGIMRIRGPSKPTSSISKWTPWTCTHKPIFPNHVQALRLPHGWLKRFSSPRYPHCDWVDHRW
jgi:hypothetical protein